MSAKNYKEKTKTSKKDMVPVWGDIFYMYEEVLKCQKWR